MDLRIYNEIDKKLNEKPMNMYALIDKNLGTLRFIISNAKDNALYSILHDEFNLRWYKYTDDGPAFEIAGFVIVPVMRNARGAEAIESAKSLGIRRADIDVDGYYKEKPANVKNQKNVWQIMSNNYTIGKCKGQFHIDNLIFDSIYTIDFDYKTETYTSNKVLDNRKNFNTFLKEMANEWNNQFDKSYKIEFAKKTIRDALKDLSDTDKNEVLSTVNKALNGIEEKDEVTNG